MFDDDDPGARLAPAAPSLSVTVPARVEAHDAPTLDEELDEATALAAVQALRKHEIGVAIGAVGPLVVGLALLVLAGAGGWAVPTSVLLASLLVACASVPALLIASRRAFLAECASLGVPAPAAKRLYGRVRGADFKLDRRSQSDRDRALAAGVAAARRR